MERRLAAILSADVVGYSRLMAADEAGTFAQHKTHRRAVIEPNTAEHHGRVVKLTGDGTLMEFASVVDAVNFAVAVQQAMVARNAGVPEERQIRYRVTTRHSAVTLPTTALLRELHRAVHSLQALSPLVTRTFWSDGRDVPRR